MQFSLPLQEENNHKYLTRNREKIETEETILKLSMRNIVGGEKDKSPFPSRLKNAFITASVSYIRFWLKETQSTNKSSIPWIGRHNRKLNIGRANPKAMFSFLGMIGGIEEVHTRTPLYHYRYLFCPHVPQGTSLGKRMLLSCWLASGWQDALRFHSLFWSKSKQIFEDWYALSVRWQNSLAFKK